MAYIECGLNKTNPNRIWCSRTFWYMVKSCFHHICWNYIPPTTTWLEIAQEIKNRRMKQKKLLLQRILVAQIKFALVICSTDQVDALVWYIQLFICILKGIIVMRITYHTWLFLSSWFWHNTVHQLLIIYICSNIQYIMHIGRVYI